MQGAHREDVVEERDLQAFVPDQVVNLESSSEQRLHIGRYSGERSGGERTGNGAGEKVRGRVCVHVCVEGWGGVKRNSIHAHTSLLFSFFAL